MKIVILSLIVLNFTLISCQNKNDNNSKVLNKANSQHPNHENKNSLITKKDLDLIDLQFGKNIEDFLIGTGLLPIVNEWSTNMDYEEYFFPKNKKINVLIAGNIIDFNKSDAKIFYFKESKKVWLCDIELFNQANNTKVIADITNKLNSKPSFYNKTINTPEHPITINENGEPETDHIEKTVQVLKNKSNTVTYFIIDENNVTKNEKKLRILMLHRNSSKYKEYLDGLSSWGYKE
ncbi:MULTISPECIES: hypothetical protein [Sphingobacterium]|uniref:hypothetical protein n=1 Tax=Sphingobacterium TaxID=28453 RepID=UPI00257EAEB2|nr:MULTISPECIES: hypothetical protein [Sphingobacterium]